MSFVDIVKCPLCGDEYMISQRFEWPEDDIICKECEDKESTHAYIQELYKAHVK